MIVNGLQRVRPGVTVDPKLVEMPGLPITASGSSTDQTTKDSSTEKTKPDKSTEQTAPDKNTK